MDEHENDLTGSFALNALGDSERKEVLQHAETSPTVREELDALQETAALLGLSTEPVAPPARVKANVMAAIRSTPQLPPLNADHDTESGEEASPETAASADQESRARPSAGAGEPDPATVRENAAPAKAPAKQTQRMFALAAGVLLIASGVLTGVVVNQNEHQQKLEQQISAMGTQQEQLTRIMTATDVKSTTQSLKDGARVNLAYSASEGIMAVATTDLPTLPKDKAYEMWLISANGAVPAGMVDLANANGMTFISGSMEGITHFGITVEPASGSPAPTTTPIIVQAL